MENVVLVKAIPHESAEKFRAAHFPHLISFQDEWLSWNGSAYLSIPDDDMKARVHAFLRAAKVRVVLEIEGEKGKQALRPFNPKRADTDEVIAALKHMTHKASKAKSPPAWLNNCTEPAPGNVISCQNGLLDITTGTLYKQTPDFFTRSSLPVAYDADAAAPAQWLRCLGQWLQDDPELIGLAQEMLGYLISNDTTLQRVFFLKGPPGTGKSTFLRVTTALIGPDNISFASVPDLAGQWGESELVGKSACLMTDMSHKDGDKLQTAANRINKISGEDPVSAQRKFKSPWQGRLPTRFLMAGNAMPNWGDHSLAMARRLLFLMFEECFIDHEDFGLEAKLLTELPSILNWVLVGLARLRERGRFIEPQACREVKTEMLYLANPVLGFVETCCKVDADASVDKDELYQEYRDYCERIGVRAPLALAQFAQKLMDASPAVRRSRPRDGKDRTQAFVGIRLSDAAKLRHLTAIYEMDAEKFALGIFSPEECIERDEAGRPIHVRSDDFAPGGATVH